LKLPICVALGLELARLADLPEDVITEARRVAEYLAHADAQIEEESESSKIAKRRKALLRVISRCSYLYQPASHDDFSLKLRTQLTQAYEHSALPDEDLRTYVGRFKNDIIQAFMH